MSNVGKKIERLISDGFSYNTLRGLSEGQINLLYNRLVEQMTPEKIKPVSDAVSQLRQELAAAKTEMEDLGLTEDAARCLILCPLIWRNVCWLLSVWRQCCVLFRTLIRFLVLRRGR